MSIKVKHGVSPIGTEHYIKMQTADGLSEFQYRVHDATGLERHLPAATPVIYFEYIGPRQKVYPPRLVNLPLTSVHVFCRPLTDGDQFWEFEKQTA